MRRRYYRRRHPFSTSQILLLLIGSLIFLLLYSTFGLNVEDIKTETILIILALGGGVAVVIFLSILTLIARRKQQRLKALKIAQIDIMTGIEFERYVGEVLKSGGYSVAYTKTSGDYGVDILAKKDGVSYAIQNKRYTDSVGLTAVSAAVAGMTYYKCDRAVVVTNSFFTRQAYELASSNKCILVDREKLTDWIVSYQLGDNSKISL